MPIAVLGTEEQIHLPDGYAGRRGLYRGQEWWIDQRDGALVLLPRRPDLRKLYVEPTTVCNLTCRTCIRNVWEDPRAHMEMGVFRQLLEQTLEFPDLKRVVFSGLGEPLAHPQILEMVRLVRERGIAVTIGSNGLLLDRDVSRTFVELGVDRLVLSLDGVRPETYADVRGATMSRVLENIRWLNEEKKRIGSVTPTLGIEFVALRSNIGELADLTGLASRLWCSF